MTDDLNIRYSTYASLVIDTSQSSLHLVSLLLIKVNSIVDKSIVQLDTVESQLSLY